MKLTIPRHIAQSMAAMRKNNPRTGKCVKGGCPGEQLASRHAKTVRVKASRGKKSYLRSKAKR